MHAPADIGVVLSTLDGVIRVDFSRLRDRARTLAWCLESLQRAWSSMPAGFRAHFPDRLIRLHVDGRVSMGPDDA